MTTNNLINLSSSGLVVHNGGGTFASATLTGNSPITVVNANGVSGNPIINFGGFGLQWIIETADFELAPNVGYIVNSSSLINIEFPTINPPNSMYGVIGIGTGGFNIFQGDATSIISWNGVSTKDPGGSISSKFRNQALIIQTTSFPNMTVLWSSDVITNFTIV